AGTLVRVETTGGGGGGDPLEREPELVALDALEGKISARAAREEYGVVLAGADRAPGANGDPSVGAAPRRNAGTTRALRDGLHTEQNRQPFFDRNPNYRALAGVDHADVDFVDSAGD